MGWKKNKSNEYIGMQKYNNDGDLMKIISYNNYKDIIIEFQDEYKSRKKTKMQCFNEGTIKNPISKRLGEIKYNNQNSLMKIIKYNNCNDIVVEFQDQYKANVHTTYQCFNNGEVKNPYYPNIFGVGAIGEKYPTKRNKKDIKEYYAWYAMLRRCYDKKIKEKYSTYKDVTCCEEWLLYENFYEWLHSQENFDKWVTQPRSAVDKDILVKGNKIYSPDTCCLVPQEVNNLFCKSNATRGDFPIGVRFDKRSSIYIAECCGNIKTSKRYLCVDKDPYKTFNEYKQYKEKLIKQVAKEEFDKGNITKRCYDAMMNYQVEITD